MAGNVAEWVVNWYNLEVDKGLRTGSRNPAPPVTPVTDDDVVQWPAKLVKGGRWGSVSGSVSIAWFELSRPGDMNSSSGVRFAMDAQRVKKRLQEGSAQVLVQRRGGS